MTKQYIVTLEGFPGGSDGKELACSAGDPRSIPGSGIFPGERHDDPFQYSCLENFMDRGTWQATVYGVTKSQKRLSSFFHCFFQQPLKMLYNDNQGTKEHILFFLQFRYHLLKTIPASELEFRVSLLFFQNTDFLLFFYSQ